MVKADVVRRVRLETGISQGEAEDLINELKKYKKGDKLKVRILEIKKTDQKVRVGLKQLQKDPFDWFAGKKVNDIITVQVISSDNKGLIVRPEECEMDFIIKKNQIAINSADARPSRFTGGERIDCAISDLDINKRKVALSIKLLEELEKKEALDEALLINDIYKKFCEEFLAIPVIQGLKSESEKFAGAEETYCIESLMQDGKALQMGTSHFLGQNFAKAFDVKYAKKGGGLDFVWATSWGVSTRLIGALIMSHSDDKGLILPPSIAPIQVVIVHVLLLLLYTVD